MDISYMEYKLSELKAKLGELTERKEYEDYDVKNSDVYYHREVRTRGSKEDIARVKSEIERLEKDIERAKKAKQEQKKEAREREIRKKEAQEMQKKEEERKRESDELSARIEKRDQKKYYKLVKSRYKKGPLFERMANALVPFRNGKPNWRKIKKYSLEELRFLVKLGEGKTLQQEENRGLDFATLKEIRESNWSDFAVALGSQYKLKKALKKEEELKENPYRL